jgi:hypothetical protein
MVAESKPQRSIETHIFSSTTVLNTAPISGEHAEIGSNRQLCPQRAGSSRSLIAGQRHVPEAQIFSGLQLRLEADVWRSAASRLSCPFQPRLSRFGFVKIRPKPTQEGQVQVAETSTRSEISFVSIWRYSRSSSGS